MSPTFFHHDFLSDSRTRITFADGTPNLYIAGYWHAQWVDTSLLLPESVIGDAILSTHCAYVMSNLEERGVSIDEVFEQPKWREMIFTYRAQWDFDARKRTAQVDVICAKRSIRRISLPEVQTIEKVNVMVASAEMLLWRNGLQKSG